MGEFLFGLWGVICCVKIKIFIRLFRKSIFKIMQFFAVPMLCPCCAESRLFSTVSPYGQGDCGNSCVPRRRPTEIRTQSKNSDYEFKRTMFHTANARLLSESAGFAPWTYASPVLRGVQGGPCARCAAPPAWCPHSRRNARCNPPPPHAQRKHVPRAHGPFSSDSTVLPCHSDMIGPRCLCLLLLVIRALCLGIDAGIAAGAEPGPAPAPDVQYTVYSNGPHAVYPHLMERSVGSGHMALSSRSDYRRHLQMCRRDLGPRYVRGHGLFNDDMSVSYARGAYSFYNVDGFVEFVLGLGMRPILELSFMPSWMARGPGPRGPGLSRGEAHAKAWQRGRGRLASYPSNFHPPARFEDWGALVEALARHLVGRFGVATVAEFYFEVWNEPDNFFWNGTQAEYFELYQVPPETTEAWAAGARRAGGPRWPIRRISLPHLLQFFFTFFNSFF